MEVYECKQVLTFINWNEVEPVIEDIDRTPHQTKDKYICIILHPYDHDLMTLILKLDLGKVKMYLLTKMKFLCE